MFVTWKGKGWVVGVTAAACLLASDFATSKHFHDPDYYARHGWPKLLACALAAALVQLMLAKREESIPGTTEAAARSFLRESDRFIYLPVSYWPAVLIAVGLLMYFVPF